MDPGDSLGIIPAADKVMDNLGNPFDPEPAIGFCILCIVDFGKPIKMIFEDHLKGICPALSICKRPGKIEID